MQHRKKTHPPPGGRYTSCWRWPAIGKRNSNNLFLPKGWWIFFRTKHPRISGRSTYLLNFSVDLDQLMFRSCKMLPKSVLPNRSEWVEVDVSEATWNQRLNFLEKRMNTPEKIHGEISTYHLSGQIVLFHQPRFPEIKGISLPQQRFRGPKTRVRSL